MPPLTIPAREQPMRTPSRDLPDIGTRCIASGGEKMVHSCGPFAGCKLQLQLLATPSSEQRWHPKALLAEGLRMLSRLWSRALGYWSYRKCCIVCEARSCPLQPASLPRDRPLPCGMYHGAGLLAKTRSYHQPMISWLRSRVIVAWKGPPRYMYARM
jgi:hypothetical protein